MRTLTVSIAIALLAGCGGGGGDSPTAPATTITFALAAGYKALALAGENNNFTISGTCGGTATETDAAATSGATFEGSPALQSASTQQLNLTGCAPSPIMVTSTTYLDPVTYMPLGIATVGAEYVVAQAKAVALPASVKVGDAGTIVTFNVYGDSTKATFIGTRTATYSVTADSATTAIVTVVQKDFVGAALQATQQTSYRIAIDGTLTLLSIDLLTSTGTHLVLMRV
ncbi:MAG TPA: hypothetical protein VGI48_06085 [Caldimonas sp.]|jgi:hypothetical protein